MVSRKHFQESAEKLARSNAELEQFAYVASHDLQEPLRAIASYVSLIEKRYSELLDEKGRSYIRHVVEGASRMQNLINDVLTYSQVGVKEVALFSVDCEAVLKEILNDSQVAIKETAAINTWDKLPTVPAAPLMIQQVFQNLISNAIKFHGERPPRIHISAELLGDDCIFSIRDQGIGISQRHQARIFKLFERLHGRDRYPGTGLGLAICKKIVERHGGKIWVSSEEGKGTTFYFSLAEERKGNERPPL